MPLAIIGRYEVVSDFRRSGMTPAYLAPAQPTIYCINCL
jgi:hypothetical protein